MSKNSLSITVYRAKDVPIYQAQRRSGRVAKNLLPRWNIREGNQLWNVEQFVTLLQHRSVCKFPFNRVERRELLNKRLVIKLRLTTRDESRDALVIFSDLVFNRHVHWQKYYAEWPAKSRAAFRITCAIRPRNNRLSLCPVALTFAFEHRLLTVVRNYSVTGGHASQT